MPDNITIFAKTNYRNELKKFGIKTDDRRRHIYLIGKTGMGKSTVLENMIIDDIRAGYGVAVVDPHGDLAEKIVEYIPTNRIKDVIYFNPADINYPIAFNVVEQVETHIQNKVGQFLSSSLMRNIIGQSESAIDIRDIMDNGKILIMNLAKGRIGEDNSALLGAMMITKIQLAAMSRVDLPENERRDFYLYIDEFQNFSTDSFANILSEARKYRLNLVLAHQYIAQLSEKVEPAVFGNVGTMIVFRVGAADAEELVKEFTPTFTEEDLVNLPKYEMYLKLMIDGIASSPFSAIGLPPLSEDEKTNNMEEVIRSSREKYASEKEMVEEKIMRWHENYNEALERKSTVSERDYNEKRSGGMASNLEQNNTYSSPQEQTEGFDAVCSHCKAKTRTPFKPDGVRPVFCKDCLSLKKEEKRLEAEIRKKNKELENKAYSQAETKNSNKKDESESENTISLSDLGQKKTVDFRGRVINTEKFEKKDFGNNKNERDNNKEDKQAVEDKSVEEIVKESISNLRDGEERDLPEGKDILI